MNFQEGSLGFASIMRVELQPGTGQIRVMATDYKTEGTAAPVPVVGGGVPDAEP